MAFSKSGRPDHCHRVGRSVRAVQTPVRLAFYHPSDYVKDWKKYRPQSTPYIVRRASTVSSIGGIVRMGVGGDVVNMPQWRRTDA